MKHLRIGVLVGGIGPEREISLRSGEGMFEALNGLGYNVKKLDVGADVDVALRESPIDVAMIALHGPYGEDGCVQGLLELRGIPYTGSGVLASAIAMDKARTKELLRFHHVPTSAFYCVAATEVDALNDLHGSFGFPCFVKPRSGGSSVDSGLARDMSELRVRCADAVKQDTHALVERNIVGREVSVAVLHGKALGTVEIEPATEFYDYVAKYETNTTKYHVPARFDDTRIARLHDLAERTVRIVGATGVARVDFLVTDGQEFVLEVNTLPGMTGTSLVPKMAARAGYTYGMLCEEILADARLHSAAAGLRPAPRST